MHRAVYGRNHRRLLVADNDERKPYFEPREAKPDHPVIKRGAPAVEAVNQVVPPDIQNGLDNPLVSKDHFCLLYCCHC